MKRCCAQPRRQSLCPVGAISCGMSLKVIWLDEGGVEGTPCFVAFPGVGDIGILTAELLSNSCLPRPSLTSLIRRFRLWLNLTRTVYSGPLTTAWCGLRPTRPCSRAHRRRAIRAPHLQHATALGLLEAMSGAKEIVGLAGFRASAEDRRTFWVATSSDDATSFESEGRTVSRTEPQAGCIGALALLVSLHLTTASLVHSPSQPQSGEQGPERGSALGPDVGRDLRARPGAMPNVDEHLRSLLEARAPAWCKITSLS